MRLITAHEELADVDATVLDAATAAIVYAALHPADLEAYGHALRWIMALDWHALWLAELVVEAELLVNDAPLRSMPCGLRRPL